MATYDKLKYDIPPYQEGNVCDFEFDMDDLFPIEDVVDITFQVRYIGDFDMQGDSIMHKKLSLSTIQKTGRYIRIPFEPSDTIGYAGVHEYEIDFVNAEGKPFATIGGSYTIEKQVNTLS